MARQEGVATEAALAAAKVVAELEVAPEVATVVEDAEAGLEGAMVVAGLGVGLVGEAEKEVAKAARVARVAAAMVQTRAWLASVVGPSKQSGTEDLAMHCRRRRRYRRCWPY